MKRITANTLHKFTESQVFEFIATHLLTQRKKSKYAQAYLGKTTPTCAYRSPEGLTCAAGCLLTKRQYRKSMEGTAWNALTLTFNLSTCHSELICRMQTIHDAWEPSKWKAQLKSLNKSKGYGVNIDAIFNTINA